MPLFVSKRLIDIQSYIIKSQKYNIQIKTTLERISIHKILWVYAGIIRNSIVSKYNILDMDKYITEFIKYDKYNDILLDLISNIEKNEFYLYPFTLELIHDIINVNADFVIEYDLDNSWIKIIDCKYDINNRSYI